MDAVSRQRRRAALWGALEALRESWIARTLLGCLDLGSALLHWLRGDSYRALDAASRIQRVLRLHGMARVAAILEQHIEAATCVDTCRGGARRALDNRLVEDFRRCPASHALFRGGLDSWERLVRMGGELMLLKAADPASGELGVLILKYTPAFGRFAAAYDLPRIFEHYQVVLEPSWIGYHDPIFRLFYARERQVVVQSQFPEDEQTLLATCSNLVPVPIGAGHWVDPHHFHPIPCTGKDYLAVLIANWAPHKRHHLLLDALRKVRDPGARIALVGYPWKTYQRERLEDEVKRRGLEGRVDFYQRIGRKEVNEVFNRSCANLLVSRKEGASKILYEGLAAGTPCIVMDDHEGVRPADINDRTGMRSECRRPRSRPRAHPRRGPHLRPPRVVEGERGAGSHDPAPGRGLAPLRRGGGTPLHPRPRAEDQRPEPHLRGSRHRRKDAARLRAPLDASAQRRGNPPLPGPVRAAHMKKLAKSLAGRALHASGLHRALLRDTGVIVAFHRVNDRTAGDALSVSVDAFERLCGFFARYYDVVSLGDLVARLEGGQNIARQLAITFDDGYLDNYEQAAPILEAYQLPATFFITSQFIETDTIAWWDAEISPPLPWMSWAQVEELASRGFSIGGHTRTHANLGEIAGDAASKEIAGGRQELEAKLGQPVDLFAYPYGRVDAIVEENRALVREAGFRCCVSCHGGTITNRSDPFRLERVPINGWFADPFQFGLEVVLGRA